VFFISGLAKKEAYKTISMSFVNISFDKIAAA
jgi:hypothetical protein